MLYRDRGGYLYRMHRASREDVCTVHPSRIGRDIFHTHQGALAMARGLNRSAGRKAYCVILGRDRHFVVIPVSLKTFFDRRR